MGTTIKNKFNLLILMSLIGILSSGCGAAALSIAGSGATLASSYKLNGTVYRTFNMPTKRVERATIRTFEKMNIVTKNVTSEAEKDKNPKRILVAEVGDRTITVKLERITARLTHMEVIATIKPIFVDKATATEIVEQTAMHLNARRG